MPCSPLGCVCGKAYLPMRFLMTIMCILGVITTYGQRVALNIAITQMVHPSSSQSTDCPFVNETEKEELKIEGGELPWSNSEQNYILGAFYIGYLVGHVPAGIWSDQLGARHIYSGGVMISTIITVLTPIVCLHTPWWVACLMRVVMGLGQSVIYPTLSTFNAKWIPRSERGVIGAMIFSSSSLGTIFGNFFSGMTVYCTGNWHWAFYIWGIAGVAWYSVFLMYVFSEPATHPNITEKEKTMLLEKIAKSATRLKIPWLGFVKDWAMWGLVMGGLGHDFTILLLITSMPKYMSDVLHVDIKENSIVSSMPFAGQWFCGLLVGKLGDYLIARQIASVIFIRKLFTTFGITLSGVFILLAGYMDCRTSLVIVFFSLSLVAKGPLYSGLKVNHLDMSINFAGVIMAIVNGIGSIAGYAGPMLIGLVAKDNTLEEWHYVFWITFAIAVTTNTFYLITATDQRRKWDVPPEQMDDFLKAQEQREADKAEKKEAKKRAKEAKKEQK